MIEKFLNPITAAPGLTPIRTGGVTGKVGSFGDTRVSTGGKTKMHKGVDLLAAAGQPVYAAADGTVVKAGWEDERDPFVGYGRRITIEHPDGHETRYAHLSEIKVAVGDAVKQGEMIGLVGRTGNVEDHAPTHLHFEIRAGGTPVDPVEFIA